LSFLLNPPQREAVRHVDGPLLVLAGAGSGKTRVITAKIAHLIERGVDPAKIFAITFTNKAAREMRERAQALLKSQGKAGEAAKVVVATFHALGLKILRMEARAAGLKPGFPFSIPRTWSPSSPNSSRRPIAAGHGRRNGRSVRGRTRWSRRRRR
jgi:ATP-dependent DNA helicase Rep